MEFLVILLVLIAALIILAIQGVIAYEFGKIAEAKGYVWKKYFWYTFGFSYVGILMVIALPKKEASDSPKKIAEELPEL